VCAQTLIASSSTPSSATAFGAKDDGRSSLLRENPQPDVYAGRMQVAAGESYPMRAFSTVGIAVKVGVGGIGFDVATPLAPKLNLRACASFFTYSLSNLSEDGFNIDGTIYLKSVNTSIDWFPFHGRSFHISPGVTLLNGDNFDGTATVLPGDTITLNDVDYTSSPTDPIIARFNTQNNRFGSRVAPSITVGFGNLVPRDRNKHWSVPFEIGFQYISALKVLLNLSGTACSTDGCGNVQTDPTTQANIQAQQNIINNDIHNLRFFPILSVGVGYRF
jgi:hypothetical protein